MSRQRAFDVGELPDFEGRSIHRASTRVTGTWPLDEWADVLLGIGDTINAIVTLQCIGVAHILDKQDRLIRVQQLKPTIVSVVQIDPADLQYGRLLQIAGPRRPALPSTDTRCINREMTSELQ
jgi:hypothetical protein